MGAVDGGPDIQGNMVGNRDYIVCRDHCCDNKQDSPLFSPPPAELGVRAERKGEIDEAAPVVRGGHVPIPRGGLSEPKRNGLALRRRNRLMTGTMKIRQGENSRSKKGEKGVSGCLSAEDLSPGISA